MSWIARTLHWLSARLREPLAQFVVLGSGLFLLHGVLEGGFGGPARATDVVVSPERIRAIRAAFRVQRNRPPSDRELSAEVERWVDDEILVQHARRLGLDQDDPIVRRRLTQKMRLLLEEMGTDSEPTEAEIDRWISANPVRYQPEPRYTFEQVWLSRSVHGANLAQRATDVRRRLAEKPAEASGLGDSFHGGRRFSALTKADIAAVFGVPFVEALERVAADVWEGPIESGYGVHFVRVEAVDRRDAASDPDVRRRAAADLREERRSAAVEKSIETLRERSHVRWPATGS